MEIADHIIHLHDGLVESEERKEKNNGSHLREDYENLQETIYILKDKLTMSSLIETRKDIYNKSFNGNGIEESFEDVMESKNKRSY